MAKMGILIDTTKCIGCGACEKACKMRNGLPLDLENNLSATAYTVVQERLPGTYVRRMCMHCQNPTCVSVCPVGAFTKTAAGPVTYDKNKCIGCRYCMYSCPFSVPKYQWDRVVPYIQKCYMCADRVAEGSEPACTAACPTGASIFGDRDQLIEEAQKRIKDNPHTYVDHLYGLEEVGGTSVLYLSNVPFEKLGEPFNINLPDKPLPVYTWAALEKVPTIVVVGGVILTGIWWITSRRDEVKKYEIKHKEQNKLTGKGDKP
ncbi:MAG: 4Fe-4S dicluster domain-containing protein [Deltaproteobacteria bacterium]|nr:4Fe-4S dicluster domain-containing protein [Deltaproteobacteria bacterium]